jgi:TRAP-type uncharacterized transport system substrate-binding protein
MARLRADGGSRKCLHRRELLGGMAVLGGALHAAMPAGAQVVKVRLGTATPGGGFPIYGAAFVEGVRRFDPALEIDAINTRGSTENVPMLEAGTLDIALVQGEVVHAALQGVGRAPADLRVLTSMYPTAGMFVVRADSPYRTIADLKGKPVAWGARFIAPDADEIRRILARHPFLKPVTQPAGSFSGQDTAIPSVGSWSFVLARRGFDETAAYRIVKALHILQQAGNPTPQLVDTTAANTVAVVHGREKLHPGAARFYREIGLLT